MAPTAFRSAAVTGFLAAGEGDDDAAEPLAEVVGVLGQAEGGHHLGGRGDVEAGLPRHALEDAAQADDDVAQGAVVHVDDPPPEHPPRVDAEPVALVDVVVEQRGEQVVGRGDGVEVAGEVEVDVVGRDDDGPAAAGRAALQAEGRPERRLAQRQADALPDPGEPLGEADAGGGLALPGVGGGDGGDQHQLARRAAALQGVEGDLGLVGAVEGDVLGPDAELRRHVDDGSRAVGHVASPLTSSPQR